MISFAAITDEPLPGVSAAARDRCIMPIKAGRIDAWLNAVGVNLASQYAILDVRGEPYYEQRLADQLDGHVSRQYHGTQ